LVHLKVSPLKLFRQMTHTGHAFTRG
jgi:hypothetical protein